MLPTKHINISLVCLTECLCAAIALLSCSDFSVCCEVQTSSSTVGEERSQTEGGGEGATAAARCVYTMSVIFTARNQTVM